MIRALLILFCVISSVFAGVSERDLFEPGDGLLTYDDLNGREWLDLSETVFMPMAEVLARVDQGGVWEGFQFATLDDVSAFADSSGVFAEDAATFGNPISLASLSVVKLLVSADPFRGGFRGEAHYAGGLVASSVSPLGDPTFDGSAFYIASIYIEPNPFPGFLESSLIEGYFEVSYSTDTPLTFSGIDAIAYWLFREAAPIPEPSSVGLAIAACLISLRLRAFA